MEDFSAGVVETMQMLCKSFRKLLFGVLGFGHPLAFSASYTRFAGQVQIKDIVTDMWRQHLDLRVAEC